MWHPLYSIYIVYLSVSTHLVGRKRIKNIPHWVLTQQQAHNRTSAGFMTIQQM